MHHVVKRVIGAKMDRDFPTLAREGDLTEEGIGVLRGKDRSFLPVLERPFLTLPTKIPRVVTTAPFLKTVALLRSTAPFAGSTACFRFPNAIVPTRRACCRNCMGLIPK